MEVTKGKLPITIVLETEEEVDLFFHIVNFIPNKEDYYGFESYAASFDEVMSFRGELFQILERLDVHPKDSEDC